MNSNSGGLINVLIVWGVASAAGFVAMAVLMVLGDWTLVQGIFAAAVVFFVLGGVLSVGFLKPLPGPVRPGTAGYAYSDPVGATAAAAPKPAPAPKPAAAPAPEPKPAAAAPAQAEGEAARPERLDAPRGGKADDLKKIKGVGPKLEQVCNRLGFYHYDQIASWTAEEVAWVDDNLEGFKGRVTRDDWVTQAKLLASGGETDFSKRVDKGDVY
ncbi:NADH:ubiquinone oxidoreductase [Roseibacterium sp. SDUM158017]|uniref:NADH:ubiquinone oxidoreductase n=1 Tax=Roseicyclus salinarum TaxID=3036773 RepID=UPI00241569D6|nr:NADH:ubiquinone oxidoreductase [Roseibacterium sp. SDUM158017]MDG4649092.1 NADH:ubiquinone oxidoreductase [Roseibacterium sp. SDUM158017]